MPDNFQLCGPTPLPTMSRDADWSMRVARTRQEAGIGHYELERSDPPMLEPWWLVSLGAGGWLLFAYACFRLADVVVKI